MRFGDFFNAATGNSPYEYQCRLREEEEPEPVWLSHGTACEIRLINVPAGLDKTALSTDGGADSLPLADASRFSL